jgi:hypothetical protein
MVMSRGNQAGIVAAFASPSVERLDAARKRDNAGWGWRSLAATRHVLGDSPGFVDVVAQQH